MRNKNGRTLKPRTHLVEWGRGTGTRVTTWARRVFVFPDRIDYVIFGHPLGITYVTCRVLQSIIEHFSVLKSRVTFTFCRKWNGVNGVTLHREMSGIQWCGKYTNCFFIDRCLLHVVPDPGRESTTVTPSLKTGRWRRRSTRPVSGQVVLSLHQKWLYDGDVFDYVWLTEFLVSKKKTSSRQVELTRKVSAGC